MAKTVILDFYGTVVHEAHALLDRIAEVFRAGGARCGNAEIHALWWRYFSSACDAAHGAAFRPQKELYAPALCRMEADTGASVDVPSLVGEIVTFSRSSAPFDDSLKFLCECPLPVCILSNIDDSELGYMIAKNGLAPAGVWTSERARAYKPRREIFESGLKAFGLRPEEALYLGDSLRNDYFGARGAGILSVWLNRLGEAVPSGVELWAPDLYSALPIVEEWKNAE